MITTTASVTLALLISGMNAASLPEPGNPPAASTADAEVRRDKPVAKGELMPGFKLLSAEGKPVVLAEQLAKGPVVVVFYRGSWCPYCVKELRSVEESVADINKLGGTVLAISPETPDLGVDLRERLGLSYELLVDPENRLADRLGLMFTLDDATVERYKKYGIDVGKSNGSDEWQLPIPATYVLDKNGTVRYAWTDEDYTKRAPAKAVLDTLRVISQEG